jgi:hypothetical protein
MRLCQQDCQNRSHFFFVYLKLCKVFLAELMKPRLLLEEVHKISSLVNRQNVNDVGIQCACECEYVCGCGCECVLFVFVYRYCL